MTDKQILTEIRRAADAGDLDQLEQLTTVARQLRALEEQQQLLAQKRNAVLATLNGDMHRTPQEIGKSPVSHVTLTKTYRRGNMFVELRLRGRPPLRIEDATAAGTLTATLEQLLAIVGLDKLAKLQEFRISRGPLVSRTPDKDFRNSRTGALYAHHRLAGTDLYVLTHSSTEEKIANLQEAIRRLGFASSDFVIGRV